MFFGQFKNILILILIGAALLAMLVGNVKHALVILAVVMITALVGFYQVGKRLGAIALTLVSLLSFLQLLRGADLAHIVADSVCLVTENNCDKVKPMWNEWKERIQQPMHVR